MKIYQTPNVEILVFSGADDVIRTSGEDWGIGKLPIYEENVFTDAFSD